MKTIHKLTTAPVGAADCGDLAPEFCRIHDLQRGTVYSLLADGKIRGNRSGVRLIDLGSVRSLILSEMRDAEKGGAR
jgi:hypothetical protein